MRRIMVDTPLLSIACEHWGAEDGLPVLLLHGFPYDPRAFDQVAPLLAAQGMRVLVPYLRGFGATRFHSPATPRSGEQAAIADDARALMDALGVERAILAGFDWGGRAACVASVLWPERVAGLVAIGGYLIQDIEAATTPIPPAIEQRAWHQYYLASERGRRALAERRRELCRHFWQQWSPHWLFSDEDFERTAASFDNPDFVEVAAHSYRHRIGAAAGDPHYAPLQQQLGGRPPVPVPAILLHGADAVLGGGGSSLFPQLLDERRVAGAGHNPPQESPQAVVQAVLDLARAHLT